MSDGVSKNISIIISTLNCVSEIDRCIESIVSQQRCNFELMVIDGGSTDGTLEKIRNWSNNINWWRSEPDNGIYDAWNKAILQSSGEWLCFLGADDTLHKKDTLSNSYTQLQSLKGKRAGLVYSKIDLLAPDGSVTRTIGEPPSKVSWQFRHGMPIHVPHTGMFHHHSIFQTYGLFNTCFRIAGDYELIIRVLKENPEAIAFMEDIVVADKGIGGISMSNRLDALRECREARRLNGMPATTIISALVLARALLREKFVFGQERVNG